MIDFRIHKEKNLCSIKSKENQVNNIFFKIVEQLRNETKGFAFYVEGSRPTYEYDINLINDLVNTVLDHQNILEFSDFEMRFRGVSIKNDLIVVLWKFWQAYEHVAICFFIDVESEDNLRRKSWYDITKTYQSYVLFKGLEDNVLWIGKSRELHFSFLVRFIASELY